jgi:succinoglycan biosynthesis protein ExoM
VNPPAVDPIPHISICICTFRRPDLLQRLFAALPRLDDGGGRLTFSCVVVDNDPSGSARATVEAFRASAGLDVVYAIEPERGFAAVRNRTLDLARGDCIAFIDDDEAPEPGWLVHLLDTLRSTGSDGVLGPVRPYFPTPPPAWVLRGRLCDRPAHPTGMAMPWDKCRTGNVLFKRAIVTGGIRFDPAFARGGEDVDFFRRACARGHRFVWCEEAAVYEVVPPERVTKAYFLRRALLQGAISLSYSLGNGGWAARARVGGVAFTALVVYALALPALAAGGFHHVMKYLIKGAHHLGRLSALCGVQLVRERP